MMEQALQIEREVKELASRMAAAEEQHKALFTRIDRQEKMLDAVHKLALSVNDLTNKLGSMQIMVDGLCDDVEEIKDKPAKRWEEFVEKVMLTIVGALVMYLLAKIGIV